GGQSEAMTPFASSLVVATGGNVSCTLTWKPQVAAFPEPSTAVQVPDVGEASSANLVPDGGEQVTCATPQLSVAVGAKLATAPSSVHSSVRLAGHAITGRVVSTTVTVAVQEELNPESGSWHVSVTLVAPSPYGPAGLWMQVASLSSSSEPESIEAAAWQLPSAVTVTLLQRALGAQIGCAGSCRRPSVGPSAAVRTIACAIKPEILAASTWSEREQTASWVPWCMKGALSSK